MTLGQRIQQYRTELGLSQEGLGEKLGVSRQAVSKWEADGAVPDTDKLIALSKLFGVTLNELLQVEAPEQKEETPAKKRDWKWSLRSPGRGKNGRRHRHIWRMDGLWQKSPRSKSGNSPLPQFSGMVIRNISKTWFVLPV